MPPTEFQPEPRTGAPPRWRYSLSARLIGWLLVAIVGTFALVGYLTARQHRRHLEAATQAAAERVSDIVKRSTSQYMLRNDQEGLHQLMATIASEPGVVRIRIFNQEGRISYSTDPHETNTMVAKDAEACYGCHAAGQPLTHLDRPDRFRIYRFDHTPVMGVINPIENRPACANAACHAHPPEQKILGVLDTNLSLATTEAGLAESTRTMTTYTLLGALLVSLLTGVLIWRLAGAPLQMLQAGTERLAAGDLGYQIPLRSRDEIGRLAASFNQMSGELADARSSLETRVEEKTRELKTAHAQMLQAEKLASIGKLAAVVAHEINNPLAGVLVYTKLLRKWTTNGADPSRIAEMRDSLAIMEAEVLRCSDIVKNMLTFARAMPMNLGWNDANLMAQRCVRLVQHKLQLAGIQLHLELAADLPPVWCDIAQVEQLLLALVINAIEAMPRGGNLWVRSRLLPARELELQVQDDGPGIPPEMSSRLFEPFQTTKESGGVGLGLAVVHQIVERHHGRISVQSDGRGTTFIVTLPVGESGEDAARKRGTEPWQTKAVC
ncbi:MAG TPA: ATP-binding protein [Terriglobales bacterium]|nr:ATP-binding protein [Terriglobales bacterium]